MFLCICCRIRCVSGTSCSGVDSRGKYNTQVAKEIRSETDKSLVGVRADEDRVMIGKVYQERAESFMEPTQRVPASRTDRNRSLVLMRWPSNDGWQNISAEHRMPTLPPFTWLEFSRATATSGGTLTSSASTGAASSITTEGTACTAGADADAVGSALGRLYMRRCSFEVMIWAAGVLSDSSKEYSWLM